MTCGMGGGYRHGLTPCFGSEFWGREVLFSVWDLLAGVEILAGPHVLGRLGVPEFSRR